MMVPMPGLLDPESLVAAGVHELSINLELHDDQAARDIMPAKAKLGLSGYMDFIERAIDAFGPGRVRSILMVGLEPLEDSLAAVEILASAGCEPVLSPFRPDPSTPLRNGRPPTVEELAEVYERSVEIAARHGLRLGPKCVPCHHNTLTFPDGTDYYVRVDT